MEWGIWWGLLASVLPGLEARYGLLFILHETLKQGSSIWPWFFLVVLLNCLIIPLVYLFLEFLHHHLMEWKLYRGTFGRFVERKKKTAEKVQEKMHNLGYLALALFVAVPFTGTGGYTGTVIAWILGLSRRKTWIAISGGIFFATLTTLLLALGVLSWL